MKRLHRKTSRLTIRPLVLSDFAAWKQAYLLIHKSKNRWDHGPKQPDSLTRVVFKKILSRQKRLRNDDKFYDLSVFNNQGAFVGVVAAMEVTRGISHTAFLGYGIFNNYWGRGYGKESVKAMIDIGFRDIKLHRIEAGIEPGNTRSIALAKSLAMRREGLKKKAIYLRNEWVDLIMFTLTSEDMKIKFDTSVLKRFF